MAPQQKRIAQQPAVGMPDAKKRVASLLKQQGILAETHRAVVEALGHPLGTEGLPEDCRQMLVAILPFALCVPSDLRSERQTTFVRMIGDVLNCVEAKLKDAVIVAVGQLAANEAQKELLESLVGEAEDSRTAAVAAMRISERAISDATVTLSAKQSVLTQRRIEEEKAGVEQNQRKASLSSFENLLLGTIPALQTRAAEATECEQMQVLAGKLGLEESVVIALPNAMGKKPDERGPFDKLLLDQVSDKMQERISALRIHIEAGDVAAVSRAEAMAAASVAVEKAAAVKNGAEESLISAMAAEAKATKKIKTTKVALAAYSPTCAQALQVKCAAEKELEAWRTAHLRAYIHLRDRVSGKHQVLEATVAALAGA